MSVIAIMFAAGAGLLVGSLATSAHDAHARFSRYRIATNSSLGTWFKSAVTAAISMVVVVLLIYAFAVHLTG